ncbi:Proteasome subunit beta type-6 [Datura stramonium]|uniref:Proteasome subunit beta type-6 n=1 Tax=Datura stramonium TaxID=4076 RepID=A0ABS8RIR7_DATST|nr:Proteasome subunit beta type-6 [Datura stramonium]
MSSLFLIDSDEPQPSNTTTTIVGVTYDDGVILGSTDTITQLAANIFSCHSALEAEPLLKDARNFILDQDKNTMVAAETIGGYGAAYLNNFLDRKWKKGMNEEDAEKLVLKALSLNISLGGGVQTAGVNSKGVTRAFHPYDTLTIRQPELTWMGRLCSNAYRHV